MDVACCRVAGSVQYVGYRELIIWVWAAGLIASARSVIAAEAEHKS